MTQDDKELLELAAKAAGIEGNQDVHGVWTLGSWEIGGVCWNPIENDGDALRLAVSLFIDIRPSPDDWRHVACGRNDKVFDWQIELLGDDPLAATRRAITRAAAEIGRSMK